MTNENSPLTDRPARNLARALAALLGILTCAGLVLGGRAWLDERQQCLAVERNLPALIKLQEITQTHRMICRLNAGKPDEATRALNRKLSAEIRGLAPSLISADDDTRNLTWIVFEALARDRLKRSGHYSTNTASIGSSVAPSGQIGQAGQIIPPPGMMQK